MYRYEAYGLIFDSTFPLPLPLSLNSASQADVQIVEDPTYVLSPRLIPAPEGATLYQPFINSAVFKVGNIGAISIEDGRVMRIKTTPEISEASLAQLILSVPIRFILHQRGFFVLHACAAVIEGKSVAFLGNSGQGKSTLAAHLQMYNYPFITDDTLAVDLQPDATIRPLPAPPQIRLFPDSVISVGGQPEQLPRVHQDYEKRLYQGITPVASSLPPLSHIYVLETAQSGSTHIQDASRSQSLQYVMSYSFVGELTMAKIEAFKDKEARIEHLRKCSLIVEAVPIRRLIRRRDLSEMPALIDMIVHDIER